MRLKNVFVEKQSYKISRRTKVCLWRKCLLSVLEKTIHFECFWLSRWQGDLYVNKYSNSFLITERTNFIMVAPYLLPSPKVAGGTHTGLSFCWHADKPKNLILCCNDLIYPSARSQSKRITEERCGSSFSLLSFKNQEAFNFLDLMESQLKEKRKISPSVC